MPLGYIDRNISMAGISEKRVKVIVGTSRKSRKSGNTASRKRSKINFAQTKAAKWPKCDTKICRFIASACFGLMIQLLIAFRARARLRKSHKTPMKSSERLAKGPTTNTRYLPSLPWDLRTCVNVEPGYFKCPFYWFGLWSFFVQCPGSLGMACL